MGNTSNQDLHEGGQQEQSASPKLDLEKLEWDTKVATILAAVNRRANIYMFLGYGVYGLGSILIMILMRNQAALATAVVMFFFQLCVIYFGTKVIFPCIGGAFHVGLLANRESMPTFAQIGKGLEQAALDIRGAGDTIRNEIAGLKDAMTKPIVSPLDRKKIVAPPLEVASSAQPDKSNGT